MLPRIRADLDTTIAQEDNVTFIEVADPISGSSFRFYDFEFALAQQLNGQPLEEVRKWAASTYGAEVTPEALQSFIEKLAGLGFLEVGGDREAEGERRGEGSSAADGLPSPHPTSPLEPRLASDSTPPPPRTELDSDNGGGVPISSAISAELGSLFAGDELVELNSSPWPARLLQGERDSADTSGTSDAIEPPSPPATVTEAAPPPRRTRPLPAEETPIASIAHAIISEGGSGAGPNENAATTPVATAAPPKPVAAPVGPGSPKSSPAAPSSPGSWVNHVRDEIEAAPASPTRLRASTSPPEAIVPARTGAPSPAPPQFPRRRFPALLAMALIAIAIAAAAWFLWPDTPGSTTSSGAVPAVHVMSPQPTVFHRWFSTPGTVVLGRDQTLGFPSAGRIQDVLPPGTTFSAGETIAHLKGTAERELAVNRLRSRIAFLEQLRSSSAEAANKAATRDAELKLTLRKRELAMALAELAKLEIRPTLAGAVAEVLIPVGTAVVAHAPVLRLRAAGPRAVFALPDEQLAAARELTFCRLETIPGDPSGNAGPTPVGGRPVDCTLPVPPLVAPLGVAPPRPAVGTQDAAPKEGDGLEGKLAVDLVGGAALAPGTPVRLASTRYENVFPVPRGAVLHQEGADRVWVISGAGRNAEMRGVEVASTEQGVALVSRGIRTGESVIVDPPASLKNGGEVYVAQ